MILPALLEGFIIWVVSSLRSREQDSSLEAGPQSSCAPSGPLPAQQYLPSSVGSSSRKTCPWWSFHPYGPAGWQAGQPFEHVYLMEEVLNLLLRSLIPNELDGRNICLRVQPQKTLPMTSADQPFCLLPSRLSSMYKHPLKYDGPVWSSNLPHRVFIQENLCIHMMLCSPYRHSSLLCLLFSGQGLLPLTAVVKF